ncbi:CesD/SycD/LcrH family type III secretion system chaperone [Shewanella sp. OPT22]|nr:CesD/SycD/LcrH family type III secretion system chaperone [Shewanella sp. OPT22]
MKHEDFDTLQKFVQMGGSLKMLTDIEDKDLNNLYQYALQLVAFKDYHGARNIFYMLWRIDSWNFDYNFSLGLMCQQLDQHHEAIYCLCRAGTLQIDNPLPSYHAGLSYSALGNLEFATKSFTASLNWTNGRPEFSEVETSAKEQLALLAAQTEEVQNA